jgi:hypothetical protein
MRYMLMISISSNTDLPPFSAVPVHTVTNTLNFMFMVPCVVNLYYNQQDAAIRSQFYFTAGSLYMFRLLPTPIIRST